MPTRYIPPLAAMAYESDDMIDVVFVRLVFISLLSIGLQLIFPRYLTEVCDNDWSYYSLSLSSCRCMSVGPGNTASTEVAHEFLSWSIAIE